MSAFVQGSQQTRAEAHWMSKQEKLHYFFASLVEQQLIYQQVSYHARLYKSPPGIRGWFHQGREAAAALAWPWCRTVRHHDAPHGPMPNTKFHNPTCKIMQLFGAEASSINDAKIIYGATHCLDPGYVEGKNLLARGGRCQNRFRSFTGQQQLRVFVFASCIPPSASPSCFKLISLRTHLCQRDLPYFLYRTLCQYQTYLYPSPPVR